MKNKWLLSLTLFIPVLAFSQVDYSNIPKNSYQKYQYQLYEDQVPQKKEPSTTLNYPSTVTTNEYVYQGESLKGISKKYQHLFNNRATTDGCWQKAAQSYNLDPWLLLAYAKVESSFRSNAMNRNNDKSRSLDIGMMQINSFWFPTLRRFGITPQHLLDPCMSLFVSSWIISQNITRFGYNIDGIGAYNAPNNLRIRRTYGLKVYRAYAEITKDLYHNNANK